MYASRKPHVNDVVHHRWMATKLALSVALHGGMAAAITMMIVDMFLHGFGGLVLPSLAFVVFAAWAALYLKAQNPVMSTFLWGGSIYIVDDGGTGIGFTTEIGVADQPSITHAVVAIVPGITPFFPPELQQFKPIYRREQMPWTFDAITQAMNR